MRWSTRCGLTGIWGCHTMQPISIRQVSSTEFKNTWNVGNDKLKAIHTLVRFPHGMLCLLPLTQYEVSCLRFQPSGRTEQQHYNSTYNWNILEKNLLFSAPLQLSSDSCSLCTFFIIHVFPVPRPWSFNVLVLHLVWSSPRIAYLDINRLRMFSTPI